MEASSLLELYRTDRRKLLEFLLSSGLIKEIRTASGSSTASYLSNINLDYISADYVLQSIRSGGVLDIGLATKKYYEESAQPMMMHLQKGENYFLLTDPKSVGSPPRRVPPPILADCADNCRSHSSNVSNHWTYTEVSASVVENGVQSDITSLPSDPVNSPDTLQLGLPYLRTGLLDDDLKEAAYEVCITCMVFSGFEVHTIENRRKDKNPKFLSALKSRKGKKYMQSQSPERHMELLDTIRMQMQISETMDAFAKRRLAQVASVKTWGQINIPEIALGLLNGTFRSDFPSEKSYIQWKHRKANIIEECFSFASRTEKGAVANLLGKIRNTEEWDSKMPPYERSDILLALRQFLSILSSKPGRFGVQGETYFWTSCYHLNVRLYEKLLCGLFEILEDGQLIEETDEVLNIIKLTWPLLGITQKLHSALYGWILFQQFIGSEDIMLLDHAIREIRSVLLSEAREQREDEYMDSLMCSAAHGGCEVELNLVQSICLSISSWCDSKLQNYHLHFTQKPSVFKGVTTMALLVGNYEVDKSGNFKLFESDQLSKIVARKVRAYIERSTDASCKKAMDQIYFGSETERTHPLALMATKLRIIAEEELNVYYPVLCHLFPEAGVVALIKLHQFYGERLTPFLKEVSSLSEDVRVVLPAAIMLENCLKELYHSTYHENGLNFSHGEEFVHYQIGEISRPIILDWIIAQHSRIMEWTGRAFELEQWEPLSHQQKHAASAVEVFRIIEETVDQLFKLRLPVDITHLQALLSIVFHTLDAYLQKIASQLVDKQNLYPPMPSLTRYKETPFPVMKKKLVESTVLDKEVNKKLHELTTAKLCVRLNTLQYIQKQISLLEEGIRESWESAQQSCGQSRVGIPETSGRILDACGESVDELFAATFDCFRDSAAHAIRSICEFIGARVVFWDLRESFLYRLYRGSVEDARLDSLLPHLDSALNNVCDLIDDMLRDRVVASISRASLEGYVWVLLDGGPSCAFSDLDIPLMEDDLNLLKDLFIADGEGLPRSLVEEEAKFAHQILSLYSLQAESVIQLLMSSSEHISMGLETHKYGHRCLGDADILLRVLCHKKDREASKFLKQHYQLPGSSEYDEAHGEESISISPLVADLLRRTASSRWADKGHSSFRSLKKKLQETTWM